MLDDAKSILADLIAFPTISAGSNLDMIAYLADRFEACGARVDLWHDATGQKANLLATIGPDGDGGLVLSGHSDVVPVSDQDWTSDPFRMVERDGKLFGRGSCDMKGFIAACLALAPRFAEMVGDRPLHFAITYDEETGCLGAVDLVEALRDRKLRPRLAVIGEPTSMRLVDGHKGCCEYSVRFDGLEGHGSTPERGVNAVEYAARYASRLLELREVLKSRAPPDSRFEPPWTTLNIGALRGGSTHNVIAAKARLDWEMRPVHDGDAAFVKTEIAAYCEDVLLPAMQSAHADAGITTEVIGEVAGLVPRAQNDAVRLLAELTGANGAGLVPFSTEAGLFQSLGMDVVICGPGSIEQAHKADEFLSVDQLAHCLDLLERLGNRWGTAPANA